MTPYSLNSIMLLPAQGLPTACPASHGFLAAPLLVVQTAACVISSWSAVPTALSAVTSPDPAAPASPPSRHLFLLKISPGNFYRTVLLFCMWCSCVCYFCFLVFFLHCITYIINPLMFFLVISF